VILTLREAYNVQVYEYELFIVPRTKKDEMSEQILKYYIKSEVCKFMQVSWRC
jgi:hypothetical protein